MICCVRSTFDSQRCKQTHGDFNQAYCLLMKNIIVCFEERNYLGKKDHEGSVLHASKCELSFRNLEKHESDSEEGNSVLQNLHEFVDFFRQL